MKKEPSYDDVMMCIRKLGVGKTFSQVALDILLQYSDADEKVLFGLIRLLGNSAFTDEAKELLKE